VIGPVDVCIIGSGAGGSVMAHYLSKAGLKVVVLEKGGYFPPKELGRKEVHTLTRIQAMHIFTPTSGKHTRVSMIAGECVGGGTVASESVTWELPEVVQDDWAKMGLESFSTGNPKMGEYKEELNKLLNVHPVPMDNHNPCNQLAMIGAQREGLEWKSVDRPVRGCIRCANCTQGCRYGAKMDGERTFLRWARKRGAEVYSGAKAEKIIINYPGPGDGHYPEKLSGSQGSARRDALRELENRKSGSPAKFTVIAGVTDRKTRVPRDLDIDSKTIIVHARQLVLSAGPIGNPRLLLKSNINPGGVVGRKFTVHPSSFHIARFPKNIMIKGWDGINDTIEITHFTTMNRHKPYFDPEKHDFIIEAALSLPWGVANLMPGTGKEHLEHMKNMNHLAGLEVLAKSDSYGRVTEDGVTYDISERDSKALLYGAYVTARVFFRVGAKEVYTGLPGLVIRSPSQLDDILNYQRGRAKGYLQKQANLYSGHQFGGCVMGADPRESFASETGECHAVKGLWVADGSAFPTNVGVNCCLSIMTVARKIADEFVNKTVG
jgi:choline dehydrogenase-like flavoprotein